MVISGGKGTLAGPLVGGLVFGIAPVILRAYVRPEAQWILYGALMILIVYILPDGIVPAIARWSDWAEGKPRETRS
jgi:branched-chain amino acid transport system permease protein